MSSISAPSAVMVFPMETLQDRSSIWIGSQEQDAHRVMWRLGWLKTICSFFVVIADRGGTT